MHLNLTQEAGVTNTMKMKKSIIYMLFIALAVACKPELKPIGEYYPAGEGIPGSWEMSHLFITDTLLPIPETRDLSILLQEPTNKMLIDVKADGTYEVMQKAVGPDFLGDSGMWRRDTIEFPSAIIWYTNTGDTVESVLNNMPRVIDQTFGFRIVRNRCDKDYVWYNYYFNRK